MYWVTFQGYVNTCSTGYLKDWKAQSMMAELRINPAIMESRERLYDWVSSCLEMEGFRPDHCEKITTYIMKEYNRV